MAQIAKINTKTYREGVNQIGDVVDIVDDTHKFDDNELIMFDIVKISGTVAEVKAQILAVIPEIKQVYKSSTTKWTDKPPAKKRLWKNGTDWYDLLDQPKYPVKHTDKFYHNFDRNVVNTTTKTIITTSEVG